MTDLLSRRTILKIAALAPVIPAPLGVRAQSASPTPLVRGPKPQTIVVPKADIDAPIEITRIIDGQMSSPSGPWVVGWYRESARLGETGNIVMAGHLDYWGIGRAVFYHLGALKEGDTISVTGVDASQFQYSVEWKKKIDAADAANGGIQAIVGPTDDESLTLITCGGDFDRKTQEYVSRTVVRARRSG